MAKKKVVLTKKSSRHLSAPIIQQLEMLSQQIGELIPATSPSKNGFCFRKLAADYKLKKYWEDKGNKKESICNFLKKVYQTHPKIFYKIFRENFSQGISRRAKMGNPVLEDEMMQIDKTLQALNVNLTKEIKALNLPKERPCITPPPVQYQKMIDNLGLHVYLLPECAELFKNGHINDAVRKGLEKYEVFIQKKSLIDDKIGTDLMGCVFNKDNPVIKITPCGNKRELGLQEGFMHVSIGVMGYWRNMFSHGDEDQISHLDAIAVLSIVSTMMTTIDNIK